MCGFRVVFCGKCGFCGFGEPHENHTAKHLSI